MKPYADGRELLTAMHDRWSARWYRTLAFSQRTRTIAEDGRETLGVWHEVIDHPGNLRIDFAPLESGAGMICAGDHIYQCREGREVSRLENWNVLLILVGDVYCQPPARTAYQLGKLGYDLLVIGPGEWQGRPGWLVGARGPGERKPQFLVDAQDLLVRRVMRCDPRLPDSPLQDVHLVTYQTVDSRPIATAIRFHQDGRLFFCEDYYDVRVNPRLDPALFDPAMFAQRRIPDRGAVVSS